MAERREEACWPSVAFFLLMIIKGSTGVIETAFALLKWIRFQDKGWVQAQSSHRVAVTNRLGWGPPWDSLPIATLL